LLKPSPSAARAARVHWNAERSVRFGKAGWDQLGIGWVPIIRQRFSAAPVERALRSVSKTISSLKSKLTDLP
jgi:hypothetical protein